MQLHVRCVQAKKDIYNKHVGEPRISPLKQLNIMGKKFQRHPFDILQEITECLIIEHLPLNRIRYCLMTVVVLTLIKL